MLTIQSHAHVHKYGTHACMKGHILEHVYGETPLMSKSKASLEAVLRMRV